MRIIIISDTHINTPNKALPVQITKNIEESDLCIHCGDFTVYSLIETLKKYTKFIGVCGNMDEPKIQKVLPPQEIITIEGVNIGITHGKGSPYNIIDYLKDKFKNANLHICLFGHTHQPLNKKIGKTIFFNPGSPTDRIFAEYNSYGILEIDKGKILRLEVVRIG